MDTQTDIDVAHTKRNQQNILKLNPLALTLTKKPKADVNNIRNDNTLTYRRQPSI